ncbi:FtsX-like permease family protein [bacterium]|nr:FtsX-like permease family protein [bacterium]
MKFPLFLALRNLLRHPSRNILYILGISITAALLLDMILLASGLSISITRVLTEMGYEVRASARGTLPFETEAQIKNFGYLKQELLKFPEIRAVDAMLGTTVAVRSNKETFTSFAIGLEISQTLSYKVLEGSNIHPAGDGVLINPYLANEKKLRPGDTLHLWMPSQSQTSGGQETVPVRVAGIAYFYLDAEGQFTIATPLPFLQKLMLQESEQPVSAMLIKLKDPSRASQVVERVNVQFPQITAYTIDSVIQEVDRQLSYFKQFSYILGGISLVVTFVLVFIITTISFHDRVGEIALLKAIGLSRKTVFVTILLEGMLTAIASAVLGAFLGKIVAIYLDRILTSAPGLPEEFSFFIFDPASVLQGFLVLLFTGFFAGIYPAAAAIRLPVAETLREEIL